MAKGSVVKEELMVRLLAIPGSFSPDGKEVRVDMVENGSPIQIKITMTAVKTPITNNPEMQIINEEQFIITDTERIDLVNTLGEMGIEF